MREPLKGKQSMLRPFVQALQVSITWAHISKDLYHDIFASLAKVGGRPTFNPIDVRKELYKLFYSENTFNLNEMADASEAFSNIVSILRSWSAPNKGQKKDAEGKDQLDLD